MKYPLILLLLLLTLSCQKKEPPPSAPLEHVRLNLRNEPATLDPRKGADVLSCELQVFLFEGLMRWYPDGSLDLGQAAALEISQDQRTYTFHLRNTLWSDGTPVTAYDFEQSWKNILDPNFPSPNAHLFYPIKNAEAAKKGLVALSEVGIKTPDARTLIVSLEAPTPYFLDLTSFVAFCPIHQANAHEHPEWAYNAGEHFISNGPYTLQEWKHNNELLLKKNPLYWENEKISCASIHFSMVSNENTVLQMYQNGKLDMIGTPLCPLPIEAAQSLNETGELLHKSIGCTTLLAFNTKQFPFNNANIRKALSYAIHRQEIVEHITQQNEQIALNAIPPVLKNNQNTPLFQDNNLAKAQELFALGLHELGLEKDAFPEILYTYSNTDLNHNIAQAIQQQWQKAFGICVKLQSHDAKILMSKLTSKEFSVAQCIWIAQFKDPYNILERFKLESNAKNYPSWENAEYIRLLEQSTQEIGKSRLDTLEQAEKIFIDEMPIAPIYHWEYAYLVKPHLRNLKLCTSGELYYTH